MPSIELQPTGELRKLPRHLGHQAEHLAEDRLLDRKYNSLDRLKSALATTQGDNGADYRGFHLPDYAPPRKTMPVHFVYTDTERVHMVHALDAVFSADPTIWVEDRDLPGTSCSHP